MRLNGNAASGGIAIAPAYLYKPYDGTVNESYLGGVSVLDAVAAVKRATAAAEQELDVLIATFKAEQQEQTKILEAHKEILQDEDLLDSVLERIEGNGYTPEYAVFIACNEFIGLLYRVNDDNIALRTADIADVRNRLVRCLRGEKDKSLADLLEDCIVVAKDLLPSDTASINKAHVMGIITESGGMTSHTAILARSFGIPALLGVKDATQCIRDGQIIVLDAENGAVLVAPDESEVQAACVNRTEWFRAKAATDAFLKQEVFTDAGEQVAFGVNIGSDRDDVPAYADFIGLFRTEFLYMGSNHLPTEEEQFIAYRRVLERAEGKPVTLRTLDIGGDKTLPYLPFPKEDNPFLGMRAIRLCFARPELLTTQLRAAYRASVYGNLQIMFPMIADLSDFRKAKALAEKVQQQLTEEGILFTDVPLGIMIEIPSAAIMADLLAAEVDFASVGTNDLCQYLFAADRMNPAVSEYNEPCSEAMLRLLTMANAAFQKAGKPLSVCGEMAGLSDGAKALVAIGISKLSMNAGCIGEVKAVLSKKG